MKCEINIDVRNVEADEEEWEIEGASAQSD